MRSLSNSLPCDSRCLCVYHQNKETIRDSNSFFQGKAPKEVVPTPPSEPFFFTRVPAFVVFLGLTRISLLWVGFGLTRIPQISQVLLLRVGNLTEVGGHFRLTRISLLWVFLGLTPIQRIQQRFFLRRGDSCALSMDFWVERA